MQLIQVITWTAMLLWGVWHVNVQLERLNEHVFEQAQTEVKRK